MFFFFSFKNFLVISKLIRNSEFNAEQKNKPLFLYYFFFGILIHAYFFRLDCIFIFLITLMNYIATKLFASHRIFSYFL